MQSRLYYYHPENLKVVRGKHRLPNLSQHLLQLRRTMSDFIRAISISQFGRHCRTERYRPAELQNWKEMRFSQKTDLRDA